MGSEEKKDRAVLKNTARSGPQPFAFNSSSSLMISSAWELTASKSTWGL